MFTVTSINAAAIRPVSIKIITVDPKIFPNLFKSTILATADVIDMKTMGTTMVNIRLRKISPRGFRIVAFSPRAKPKNEPMIMPPRRIMGK